MEIQAQGYKFNEVRDKLARKGPEIPKVGGSLDYLLYAIATKDNKFFDKLLELDATITNTARRAAEYSSKKLGYDHFHNCLTNISAPNID